MNYFAYDLWTFHNVFSLLFFFPDSTFFYDNTKNFLLHTACMKVFLSVLRLFTLLICEFIHKKETFMYFYCIAN